MIRPAATLAVEVTLKMIMTSRMGRENSLDDMLLEWSSKAVVVVDEKS